MYYCNINELWSCLMESKVNRETPLAISAVHPYDGHGLYVYVILPSYSSYDTKVSIVVVQISSWYFLQNLFLVCPMTVMNVPGW